MFFSILEQTLLFFPLIMGIFISYGVLRIPDLTTDGSFVLGAALFGLCVHAGLPPVVGMAVATCGGILMGITVSLLQTRLKLNPLIAGILLVFIINSVILKLLGKPNLSLFNQASLFGHGSKLMLLSFFAVGLGVLGAGFLASRLGLFLHAYGNNPTLLDLSGKRGNHYRMLGLSISNGLVSICGALTAQASGYVDINMGTGIILISLGMVIIGRQLYTAFFKNLPFAPLVQLASCLIGGLIYFSTVNLLIYIGVDPIHLRFMIGCSLIAFLAFTRQKTPMRQVAI